MPNTENITKWVEALESGEYEQAKGLLAVRQENGKVRYCCLGVACEVAMKNGVGLAKDDDATADDGTPAVRYDGWDGILPEVVQEWLGLDTQNPSLIYPNGKTRASALNDNYDYSFAQIAQAVRETYLVEA